MSKLFIVESPGKIKTIKSYLGPDFIVAASVGHITCLADGLNSIDFDNNFEPTYGIDSTKKQVVKNLKTLVSKAKEVIIATDDDMEGHAISYHLVRVLGIKNYKRVVFHEITKSALTHALSNSGLLDYNKFYAQQTRLLLDCIVGFKLSPLLKTIPNIQSKSLGIGRVQASTLRLIVENEEMIKSKLESKSNSEFVVSGQFQINSIQMKLNLTNCNIPNFHQIKIQNFKSNNSNFVNFDSICIDTLDKSSNKHISLNNIIDVKFVCQIIKFDSNFVLKSNPIITKRYRYPPQPFITSSLQQEASYKLKSKLAQTMSIAQKLYEKGLITYMRTDSPSLSPIILSQIKQYILNDKSMGEQYYHFRQFKSKNQHSQEAHEAIRPTHIEIYNLSTYNMSNTLEEKLYQLIWKRTVSSQMSPAEYNDQHITVTNSHNIEFTGINSIQIFDGYLKLYNDFNDDDLNSNTNNLIDFNKPNMTNSINWSNIKFVETFGGVPMRYSEPTLVKKLETLGIGRPSTYANIISKIQSHNYVQIANSEGIEKRILTLMMENKFNQILIKSKYCKQQIGNEKQKLIPTSDGKVVIDYLTKHFYQILDYKFTAHMENLLDDIANGNRIWSDVLREYYNVLRDQFNDLGLNITNKIKFNSESNQIVETKPKQIIGTHPKYGPIEYFEAKFGPVFKITYKISKSRAKSTDLFVNAGKLKPTDSNILESAIKFIDYKISKLPVKLINDKSKLKSESDSDSDLESIKTKKSKLSKSNDLINSYSDNAINSKLTKSKSTKSKSIKFELTKSKSTYNNDDIFLD